MKKLGIYSIIFLISIGGGVALLLISLFAPQSLIDQNVYESAFQMAKEGTRPAWFDMTNSAQLDNWTDALILTQCKSMSDVSSIFSNPSYGSGEGPVDALLDYVQMDDPSNPWYYSKYWMGFRAVLRWVLVFFNYFQIRRYSAFVFFALFFGVFSSIAKNLDLKTGYIFVFSMLLVRPYIICSSLQFSPCFYIAFFAMLLVPWINKHEKYETLFFMELGILTMYFDFYTTPIITFGLPMIYLYLLHDHWETSSQMNRIGKNAVIWLVSYVATWLSKLILTELFTTLPAFHTAYESVAYRLLFKASTEELEMYSIMNSLIEVMKTVAADFAGAVVWTVAVLILAVILVIKSVQKKIDWRECKNDIGLLVLAMLPVLWFCIAAQPTVIHAWFQYRGIAVTFWAVSLFYFRLLSKRKMKYLEK